MSLVLRRSRRLLTELSLMTVASPRQHQVLPQWHQKSLNQFSTESLPTSSQPTAARGDNGTIKVTQSCRQRLREILDEEGTFLRVSVEGGGCSGFQYKFDIDDQLGQDDIIVHRDVESEVSVKNGHLPAVVVTDPISLDLIRGSTLDYERELIRSAFRVINNPRAEQGCSCGASFNLT